MLSERSLEAAELAIGTKLAPKSSHFNDALHLGSEAAALYPIQIDAYRSALYGVATVVHQNRRAGAVDPMPTAEQYGKLREKFFPLNSRLRILNGVIDYNREQNVTETPYLKAQQRSIFGSIEAFLSARSAIDGQPLTRRGYVKSPTGTGKTVIISKLIEASCVEDTTPPKTLILVPRTDLVDQTIGRDGKSGLGLHSPGLIVSELTSKKHDPTGDVVVATYGKFNSAIERGEINKDDFGLIICDEAHRAIGPKIRANLEEFCENKVTIGLTATDKFGTNHQVKDFFQDEIYSLDLREAIERTLLPSLQVMVYKTSVDISDLQEGSDFTQKEFDRLIEDETRDNDALAFAKAFVEQGKSGIISCIPGGEVLHARTIAEKLGKITIIDPATGEQRPIRAMAIHQKIPKTQRKKIYEAYENGEIDILTFVDTLNEGWDSQKADFLINLRPTTSPVLGDQRLGRILRGTNIKTVVDFLDTTKRSLYLALHSLREVKYSLGKIYGSVNTGGAGNTQEKRGFLRLPEHIVSKLMTLSDKPLASLVAKTEYAKTEYADMGIDEVAAKLNTSPIFVAMIGSQLGVLKLEENERRISNRNRGRNKTKIHKSITGKVNELDIDHIAQVLQSPHYLTLSQKDPAEIKRIASLFFTGDKAGLIDFDTVNKLYRRRLETLVRAKQPVDTAAVYLKESVKNQEVTKETILEIIEMSDLVPIDHPERDAFIKIAEELIGGMTPKVTTDVVKSLADRGRLFMLEKKVRQIVKKRLAEGDYTRAGFVLSDVSVQLDGVRIETVGKGVNKEEATQGALISALKIRLRKSGQSILSSDQINVDDLLNNIRDDSTNMERALVGLFISKGYIGVSQTKKAQQLQSDTMLSEGNNYQHEYELVFKKGQNTGTRLTVTGTGTTKASAKIDARRKIFSLARKEFPQLESKILPTILGNVPRTSREKEHILSAKGIEKAKENKILKKQQIDKLLAETTAENVIRELCMRVGSSEPKILVNQHQPGSFSVSIQIPGQESAEERFIQIGTGNGKNENQAINAAYRGAVAALIRVCDKGNLNGSVSWIFEYGYASAFREMFPEI